MPADATPDLAAIAAALAARHGGDASKALEKLVDENHDLRAKNRTLRDDLKAAQDAAEKGKTPEGAVVLMGKDAEAWGEYQKLGKPADLTKQLEDGKTAATRLAEHEADALLVKLAEAQGWKAAVVKRLIATDGLTASVKDETVNGETRAVGYLAKGDGTPVKAEDYASEHWAEFVPALAAEAGTAAKGGAAAAGPKMPPSGPAKAGSPPPPDAKAQQEQMVATGAYSMF